MYKQRRRQCQTAEEYKIIIDVETTDSFVVGPSPPTRYETLHETRLVTAIVLLDIDSFIRYIDSLHVPRG